MCISVRTRRRQKSGGKVVAILIAVVLLLAVGGGVGAWGAGYALTGEPNPTKWNAAQKQPGDGDDVPELTPGGYAAIDADGNLMRSGVIYNMPESLVFIGDNTVTQPEAGSRAATTAKNLGTYKSVTVTATVTPNNATDKRVTWSSDNSGVDVAPLSDGSNIAVITLIDASVFSENDVTITCTSVSNPAKFATCKVSRLATADEIELNCSIKYTTNKTMVYVYDPASPPYKFSCAAQSDSGSPGLRYGDIENIRLRVQLEWNSEFFERINYYVNSPSFNADDAGDYVFENLEIFPLTPYELFYSGLVDRDKLNNAFLCACKDVYGGLTVPVEIEAEGDYVYNGVTFGTVCSISEIYYINYSSLWVEVGGVEIGDDIVVTP